MLLKLFLSAMKSTILLFTSNVGILITIRKKNLLRELLITCINTLITPVWFNMQRLQFYINPSAAMWNLRMLAS